jgi:hypothetical protein
MPRRQGKQWIARLPCYTRGDALSGVDIESDIADRKAERGYSLGQTSERHPQVLLEYNGVLNSRLAFNPFICVLLHRPILYLGKASAKILQQDNKTQSKEERDENSITGSLPCASQMKILKGSARLPPAHQRWGGARHSGTGMTSHCAAACATLRDAPLDLAQRALPMEGSFGPEERP